MMTSTPSSNKFLKFLQFPVTRILLGFIILSLIVTGVQAGMDATLGREAAWAQVLSVVVIAGVALVAYAGFVRMIERRTVSELALSFAVRELIEGVLVGAGLFTVTIGILWGLGYYRVTGFNGWGAITSGLALAVVSGVFEELLLRGILYRVVEEYMGTWFALIFSAAFFGFAHLANPNATVWGAAAIAIEAGILLAAGFVVTRRLWLPIGIHFAWNFTQGAIFGVAVSGNEVQGLLQATLQGPALLSGGAFGAEASIFAVIVCLAAGVYYLQKARKQGKFVSPFWRRKARATKSDADLYASV